MALTWTTNESRTRATSDAGHVITGTRNSNGKVFYNCWAGEPQQSRCIEAGFGPDGLAQCKSAAERHAQESA